MSYFTVTINCRGFFCSAGVDGVRWFQTFVVEFASISPTTMYFLSQVIVVAADDV